MLLWEACRLQSSLYGRQEVVQPLVVEGAEVCGIMEGQVLLVFFGRWRRANICGLIPSIHISSVFCLAVLYSYFVRQSWKGLKKCRGINFDKGRTFYWVFYKGWSINEIPYYFYLVTKKIINKCVWITQHVQEESEFKN